MKLTQRQCEETGLEPQITAGFTQWLSGIGGEAEKELIQVKQLWRMYQNLPTYLCLCRDSFNVS